MHGLSVPAPCRVNASVTGQRSLTDFSQPICSRWRAGLTQLVDNPPPQPSPSMTEPDRRLPRGPEMNNGRKAARFPRANCSGRTVISASCEAGPRGSPLSRQRGVRVGGVCSWCLREMRSEGIAPSGRQGGRGIRTRHPTVVASLEKGHPATDPYRQSASGKVYATSSIKYAAQTPCENLLALPHLSLQA